MRRPLVIAVVLGSVLTVLSIVTEGSVALSSLAAAFGLGVTFPHAAVAAGAAVTVPQVCSAIAVGAGDSAGLALLALAAGAVAIGFSALFGAAGGMARNTLRSVRS